MPMLGDEAYVLSKKYTDKKTGKNIKEYNNLDKTTMPASCVSTQSTNSTAMWANRPSVTNFIDYTNRLKSIVYQKVVFNNGITGNFSASLRYSNTDLAKTVIQSKVNPNAGEEAILVSLVTSVYNGNVFPSITVNGAGTSIQNYDITFSKQIVIDVSEKTDEEINYIIELIKHYESDIIPDITLAKVNFEKLFDVDKISPNTLKNTDIITCIGDSQTGGHTATDVTSYPQILAESFLRVGYARFSTDAVITTKIINLGNGGENVNDIACRCGGLGLYVKPFTIPADTSQTLVEIYASNNGAFNKLGISFNGLNDCIIDGVVGVLRNTSGSYYFNRKTAGETHALSTPAKINTYFENNFKDVIKIIEMGQNLGYTTDSELVDIVKSTIGDTKRYIIMTPETGDDVSQANLNMLFGNAFGNHYLNIRWMIAKYGMAYLGLTPTETEITQIANGQIPDTLWNGPPHLGQNGLTAKAYFVYVFGRDLGYWS